MRQRNSRKSFSNNTSLEDTRSQPSGRRSQPSGMALQIHDKCTVDDVKDVMSNLPSSRASLEATTRRRQNDTRRQQKT